MKYLILTLALVSSAALAHDHPVIELVGQQVEQGVSICYYLPYSNLKPMVWKWPEKEVTSRFGTTGCPYVIYADMLE